MRSMDSKIYEDLRSGFFGVFGFFYVWFLISSVSIFLRFYFVVVLFVIWLCGGYLLFVLSGYEFGLWNDIGFFGCFGFVWMCFWFGMNVNINYKVGMFIGKWIKWIERNIMVMRYGNRGKEDWCSVGIYGVFGRLIRFNIMDGYKVCFLVLLNQKERLYYLYKIGIGYSDGNYLR